MLVFLPASNLLKFCPILIVKGICRLGINTSMKCLHQVEEHSVLSFVMMLPVTFMLTTQCKIAGRISTLQMVGTMTTDNNWIDGSGATFEQVFRGAEMLYKASSWLSAMRINVFSSQPLFLFLSDTALQPDNRITRYRKISRRVNISTFVEDKECLLEEGFEECRGGLLFWAIICVSPQKLPAVIDYLRSDRGSFIFLARQIPKTPSGLSRILSRRGAGEPANIDQKDVIQDLIHDGLIPIRIWGPSGDQAVWIEIHTDADQT